MCHMRRKITCYYCSVVAGTSSISNQICLSPAGRPLSLIFNWRQCSQEVTLDWPEIRSQDTASSPSHPSSDTTPVIQSQASAHTSGTPLASQLPNSAVINFACGWFYSVSLCDINVDKTWINVQNRKDFAVTTRNGKQRRRELNPSAVNVAVQW